MKSYWYWYPIIIFIFLIIGIIHGVIDGSPNILFTWTLIGIWIAYTIGVFKKVRKIRTYSTPHNSGLLILSTLFIGVFYSFWGRYTALLSGNITGLDGFYFSVWTLLIATPYLIYGMVLLRLTFKKYYSVYFGTKSVVARKFGMTTIILLLFIELVLFLARITVDGSTSVGLQPNYNGFNIPIFVFSLYIAYLFIRYGIIQRSASISDLSPDYINRRLTQAERVANQNSITARNAVANGRRYRKEGLRAEKERQQRTKREAKRKAELERRRRIEVERRRKLDAEREKRRSEDERRRRKYEDERRRKIEEQNRKQREKQYYRQISQPSARTSTSKTQKSDKKVQISKGKIKKYQSMRPKAGIISSEDFKCIFCFELPKYPQDKYRGIVLCPNCKHPAHADEFKNWARNSPLCSRCDSEISASFRRNPTIIPVKDYLEAAKFWIKKEKNR